ncbi:hypothetical protein SEMRO_2396_G326030.1 [Seminavis robusta]|uniref:Uncharacterized protein n=1 Tax=Seminavis robusta TaxID=568900 RepID=A0A9N8F042_9STRA|nr:hypothetical protein SEMRO_2396_G326030.1 [Seminavis robusta]|eukprot:Sro2396_g326030.1 n/a (153) ;mRNA; f:11123-11581
MEDVSKTSSWKTVLHPNEKLAQADAHNVSLRVWYLSGETFRLRGKLSFQQHLQLPVYRMEFIGDQLDLSSGDFMRFSSKLFDLPHPSKWLVGKPRKLGSANALARLLVIEFETGNSAISRVAKMQLTFMMNEYVDHGRQFIKRIQQAREDAV